MTKYLTEKEETAQEIIAILRDDSFGNEQKRKKFVNLITSLFDMPDKEARKFFKKLGQACTDIGKDMIGDGEKEKEELDDSKLEVIETKEVNEMEFKSKRIRDLMSKINEGDGSNLVVDTDEFIATDKIEGVDDTEMYEYEDDYVKPDVGIDMSIEPDEDILV